jgi:hypothetical protein
MNGLITRFAHRTSGSHARQLFGTQCGSLEPQSGSRTHGYRDCTREEGGAEASSRMEDRLMRTTPRFTITWLLLVAAMLSTCTGCLIPMYSGDPVRRAKQLIHTSEDLRAITDEWERIWFLDQPSHMKPYRTHGGIL